MAKKSISETESSSVDGPRFTESFMHRYIESELSSPWPQSSTALLDSGADSPSTLLDSSAESLYDSAPVFEVPKIAINPRKYEFPFENLVFKGGGNKGYCYIGALQCLEEHGIIGQLKRFAGTSAGAFAAAMAALGFTSEEMAEVLKEDLRKIFCDARFGTLSLIPNIMTCYGWNPGAKLHGWLGQTIAAKCVDNNPDMTFYDLYQQRGKELCVVVTNLSHMDVNYLHPKTTPDMPIRDALRMSMALPGIFAPIRYDVFGQTDTLVDGGLFCNYPIHCFDGWYLSMEQMDSFLIKLHPLKDIKKKMENKNRFGGRNYKTFGCLAYHDTEPNALKFDLEKREGVMIPEKPSRNTSLFKKYLKKRKAAREAQSECEKTVKATDTFMKVLNKYMEAAHGSINYAIFQEALEDDEFTNDMSQLLFGKDTDDADGIIETLGVKLDRPVSFMQSFYKFCEIKAVHLQSRMTGYERNDVQGLGGYLAALQDSQFINGQLRYLGEADAHRTAGINTRYIGTMDFGMEDADREFLVQRGYNSMEAFLRHFVKKFPDQVKTKQYYPNIPAAEQNEID